MDPPAARVKPLEGLAPVGEELDPHAPRSDTRTTTPANTMLTRRYARTATPVPCELRVATRKETGNGQSVVTQLETPGLSDSLRGGSGPPWPSAAALLSRGHPDEDEQQNRDRDAGRDC
jgi:hypothetical protein